jgi:predicted RNA-binding Zn-ribbon protein involved in translation (DUF1610 family)
MSTRPIQPHKRVQMIAVEAKPGMSILAPTFIGPAMKGPGTTDHVCPTCGQVLLEGSTPGSIRNVAFTCFKCKTTSTPPMP